MHFSLINAVIIIALLCAWGVAGLYHYRCWHQRRQRQSRWEQFESGHGDLDRELSLIWQLLKR